MSSVLIRPSWFGRVTFWVGSDEYGLKEVILRAPLEIPLERIIQVYEIKAKSLIGLPSPSKYAIEYQSKERHCFITLEKLPEELAHLERMSINPPGAAMVIFQQTWREPSALLLPLLLPVFIFLCLLMLGLWNDYVLNNHDLLAFFARPGCAESCVQKVLSIHSLVAFLFLIQLSVLLLPLLVFYFHAPRYRTALNYRMAQGYSLATIVVGVVIFGQLMAFFPFRQYGKFTEMGFNPRVEKIFKGLRHKK